MADFFTRLAERALGVAQVAAPDLPPMFAPAAQTLEVSAETAALRQSVGIATIADKSSALDAPLENLSSRRPVESARDASRRRDEVLAPLVKMAPPIDSTNDTQIVSHRNETVLDPGPFPRAGQNSKSEAAPSSRSNAVLPAARDETGWPDERHIKSSEARIDSPVRAESAPPTIHVTIGRVEVRAVTAPAEPARPRERKAPPLRSLDQYLRERNEGRR